MLNKFVLFTAAISFISYGLLCFFAPELPAGYIGYALTNADSRIEMVAMYGGLEIGIGVFCLLGAIKPEYTKAGLLLIIFTVGGLAIGRHYSFALNNDPVTSYTYSTIVFETVTAIIAAVAFYKSKP